MSESGTEAVVKKPRLPFGWTVHVSKSYPDRVYYFNDTTGCTTWEIPVLEESLSASPAGPDSPDETLFGKDPSSEPEDYEEEPEVPLSLSSNRASSDDECLDDVADLIVQNTNIKDVSKLVPPRARNSTDTTSSRPKPELPVPVKPAIKNYLDLPPVSSTQSSQKTKVRFADSVSPQFSPEDVSGLSDDSISSKDSKRVSKRTKKKSKTEMLQSKPKAKTKVLETFHPIPARANKYIPPINVDPRVKRKRTPSSVPEIKFIPRSVREASQKRTKNCEDSASQREKHASGIRENDPPHRSPNLPTSRLPIPKEPSSAVHPHSTSKIPKSKLVDANSHLPLNVFKHDLRKERAPNQPVPTSSSNPTSEALEKNRNSNHDTSQKSESISTKRRPPAPSSSLGTFKSTFVGDEPASSSSSPQTSFTPVALRQVPHTPVCTVTANVFDDKSVTSQASLNSPSLGLRQVRVTPSLPVSTAIPSSYRGFEETVFPNPSHSSSNISDINSRKKQASHQAFPPLSEFSADSKQWISTPTPFSSSSLITEKNGETCSPFPPFNSRTGEQILDSGFILWDNGGRTENDSVKGFSFTESGSKPQENIYTFNSVPTSNRTSVSVKEDENMPAPKKKRLSIDHPYEHEEAQWPRTFEDGLDSAGQDGSSCSSVGTASVVWESLLRPSKPGIASVQPQARSFGDHWGAQPEEAMDWEPADTVEPCNKPAVKSDGQSDLYAGFSLTAWHIVLDTNILLHDLKFVTELRDTSFKDCGCPVVVIPWVVLQELDLLKAPRHKNEASQTTMGKARVAVSFILENLSADHPRMKGQSYDEFQEHKFPSCTNNDDKILHFCSSLQKKGCHVTLLTEDKNLRNKSLSSRLEACSKADLLKKKRALPTLSEQPLSPLAPPDDYNGEIRSSQKAESLKADEIYCRTKAILYKVLKQVLVQGMKRFSKTMWQRLVVRKPPWTLDDILYCLHHHWIAVFHLELPPNAKGLVETLESLLKKKSRFGHSLPGMRELVETSLSLCSCVANNKSRAELVRDAIKELKSLLQACQGQDLGPAADCSLDALAANCGDDEAPENVQEQLQEVQNFFTALWERVNTFCAKLEAMMSGNGAVVREEVEKNIAPILRTVKQFVQLNRKLLKMKVSGECRELLELHSLLLSDAPDFVVDPFSEHSLSLYYKQNKDMLAEAHVQFEKFVTTINSGVRYLMSNRT